MNRYPSRTLRPGKWTVPARTASLINRRTGQIALGLLWLLDGALQLQPFMFGRGFARQVIAPTASGQPSWIATPVRLSARHIAEHPAAFNTVFAAVQLALGVAFLIPRLARPAVVASIAWSGGVWYFGEGLGSIASGHATLITGAPGAVLLYAVLAAACWPASASPPDVARTDPASPGLASSTVTRALPIWLPWAWMMIWLTGALLQLLPGQNTAAAVQEELAGAGGAPGWTASLHTAAADLVGAPLAAATVAALMAFAGAAAVLPARTRTVAAILGAFLAVAFWILGQDVGSLSSGQSTDPNTGPVLVLFAVALLGVPRPHLGAHRKISPTTGPRWASRPSRTTLNQA